MTKLSDMPPEIRAKIYKKLDIVSLLKFGESGTKFIPEILRGLNQSERKELWFEAAKRGYCRWLTIMAIKQTVNTKDDKDATALHLAAYGGHLDCMKALIEAGADLNAKDKHGQVALYLAAGDLDCLKALIRASADLNLKTNEGWTALHLAALYGKLDCVKALIQAGADLNAQTSYGCTALYLVARYGRKLDCLKVLIEAGADLNAKDKYGRTVLHWAALDGNLSCVKVLIQAGANLNLKTNDDQTALDLATNNIRKILKNAGAQ